MTGAGTLPRSLRSQRGQTLIEFALAAAVFFLMMFGTIEFGLVVWQYNLLSSLAQEAARWGAVRGARSTVGTCPSLAGSSGSICPASAEELQAFVRARAFQANVVVTSAAPSSLLPGDVLRVGVAQDASVTVPFLPAGTIPLRASAEMIMLR